ncbi:MAG: 30S ribosomal protein S27e [Candidatus Aenigmarchaeota archaeon]|nr:30S ribosomal protein S27e [Candidatus Aenigmarchaeota archaeon]
MPEGQKNSRYKRQSKVKIITGKFIKVKCEKCNNEQNIYSNAAMDVKCLVCGEVLSTSTGGISDINVKILSVLN